MDKKKPVEKIEFGKVKAAIWENQTSKGKTFYSVTVQRVYREDNNWKYTGNFNRDDLPIVSKAIDQAHTRILELETANKK